MFALLHGMQTLTRGLFASNSIDEDFERALKSDEANSIGGVFSFARKFIIDNLSSFCVSSNLNYDYQFWRSGKKLLASGYFSGACEKRDDNLSPHPEEEH